MSIRHVRFFKGSRKIYGQVINVPVDVDTMVQVLARALEDDYAFNVKIEKNLLNKSFYMSGGVSKSIVKLEAETSQKMLSAACLKRCRFKDSFAKKKS